MKRGVFVVVAVLALAACGGGGGGGSSDAAQITKVWQDFFSGKVSASKKTAMVENGATLEPTIEAMAQNPYAERLSAKVSKVRLCGDGKTATVAYAIYLAGSNYPKTPVMRVPYSTALKQNGHWVIAVSTLCTVLPLIGDQPPPACPRRPSRPPCSPQ